MREKRCTCDICPSCLNVESDNLWICYYDQYRTTINKLLKTKGAKDCLLPLLNMVSTYLELWVKAIGLNFGLGSDNTITAEIITGHNLLTLIAKLRECISWEEHEEIEDDLLVAETIIEFLAGLTANENVSLSEATRYPKTIKKSYSLNRCVVADLDGVCDKFGKHYILKFIKDLMEVTYSIYDQIYKMRVL